ncbi:tetratricopeptide repeat protein [Helicobacter pylori]|uniref:tetratricopeptide repeat protein n=1 Tax=Helicobacter pylori TaxID=210 RepID=UPI003F8E456F
MLENFKKAIFRALCLGCVLIGGGGGLMAEPNPEELVLLGIKSYEKQDFSKAKGYFEKACDLNNGGGCSGLVFLYGSGKGVKQDLTKVAYFYTKACDLKDGWGCSFLGVLYYNGEGVEKNLIKAAYLYSKACKLEFQLACEMLK